MNLTTISLGTLANLATLEADQVTVPQVDIMDMISLARSHNAPLSNVTLNVDWTDCTTELLDYLVGLNTSDIRGTISVASGQVVTLDQKSSYLRWGNIDDPTNALYITYVLLNVEHVFITGQKYFTSTGTTQFGITAGAGNNVAIRNGALAVTWSIETNPKFTISQEGARTGEVQCVALNSSTDKTRYALTVTVELIGGNTVSATWHIGAFMRLPERGDFAYADGTFDDEVIGGKTMVGFAFGVADIFIGEEVKGRSVDVCSMRYYIIQSNDGLIFESGQFMFGVAIGTSNAHIPQQLASEITAAANVDLTNLSIGSGTSDVASKNNTRNVASVAKAVISDWLWPIFRNLDLSQYEGGCTAGEYAAMTRTKGFAMANHFPSTLVEFGDVIEAFLAKMRIDGNTSPDRFEQLLYPAPYSATIYEPTVNDGETLSQSYKSGSWYLPAGAVLVKLARFNHASRGKVNGRTPSSDYANEDQTLADADYPLIANLLKRMEDVGLYNIFEPFHAESNIVYHAGSSNSTSSNTLQGYRFYDMAAGNVFRYGKNPQRAITNVNYMID